MDRWSAVTALVSREATHSKSLRNGRVLFFVVAVVIPSAMVLVSVISGSGFVLFEPMPRDMTPTLVRSLIALLFGSVAVFGLAVSGGATSQRIGLERSKNTWALFRLAPISGMEMAIAHWCTSLVPVAYWTAMHLPPLVFLMAMQSQRERVSTVAVLALVFTCCAAVASVNVMASALLSAQRLASLLTLLVVAMWAFGLRAVVTTVFGFVGWLDATHPFSGSAERALGFLWMLSPVFQFRHIMLGGGPAADLALSFVGLTILVAVSLFVAGWSFKQSNPYAALERRTRQARQGVISTARKRFIPRRAPIHDRLNPFFVLELRHSYLGYPVLLLIYLGLPTVAFFGLTLSIADATGSASASVIVWLVMVIAAIVLMGPMFAGPLIARERDANTFELVALTGRTPREILRGKYLGALAAIGPFILIALSSYLPIWFAGGGYYGLVFASFITAGVCMLLQLSAGLCASILSRNARDASSLSLYSSIALLVGGPILFIFVRGFVFDLQTTFDTSYSLLAFTSPLAALVYFATMVDDRWRFTYLLITLGMFSGLAWCLFRGAAGLLRLQLAGAGRYSNRPRAGQG